MGKPRTPPGFKGRRTPQPQRPSRRAGFPWGVALLVLGVIAFVGVLLWLSFPGAEAPPDSGDDPGTAQAGVQPASPTDPVPAATGAASPPADDHGPRVVSDPPAPRPGKLRANDREDGTRLAWDSVLGPGGACVPPRVEAAAPDPTPSRITRLLAVTFPPDGRDLLFVGLDEPGKPPLDPQELFDAFVVALRAFAAGTEAPGVSFDPTPEQRRNKLKTGDRMPVRYIGGDAGTVVGQVAYESDRLLKCLAHGEDNETGEPVKCSVPGYDSLLGRLAARGGGSLTWQRLWFEQQACRVRPSADGRTWWVGAKLCVQTVREEVREGRRVEDRPPDPVTKAFVEHVTEHYDRYADDFSVLRRLHAFAQVTSVARAVLGDEGGPADRPHLDLAWLLSGYPLKEVKTPLTAAAIVSTKGRFGLSGGVNLGPKNAYEADRGPVADLQGAVLGARRREPARRTWVVRAGDGEARVLAWGPAASPEARLWQTDLRVGGVAITRDHDPRGADGAFGRGGLPRLPRLEFSRAEVTLESGEKRPGAVYLSDGPDRVTMVNRPGEFGIPGVGRARAYFADGTGPTVCVLRDAVVLFDGFKGPITFTLGRGLDGVHIPEGARVVLFSPDAGHLVQEVRTAGGRTKYEHEGARLVALRDDAGNSIRLTYDGNGRVKELAGSDGSKVGYVYGPDGSLRAVTAPDGPAITYWRGKGGVPRVAVRVTEGARPEVEAAGGLVVRTVPGVTAPAGALPRLKGSAHVALIDAARAADPDLCNHAERVLAGEDAGGESRRALAGLVGGTDTLLVMGNNDLAEALRLVAPEKTVYTADDQGRAERNLAAEFGPAVPAEVLVLKGLRPATEEALKQVESGAEGSRVLLVPCHVNAESLAELSRLADAGKFNGRAVILLGCGLPETDAAIARMFEQHAVRVYAFGVPIDQRLLAPLADRIQRGLREAKEKNGLRDLDRIIDSAIKDASDGDQERPYLMPRMQIGRAPGARLNARPGAEAPARAA